jgi:predicted nucleotide-binding protein
MWREVQELVRSDPELRRYMQLSFDAFHPTGDWPDVEKLQRRLLRDHDQLDLYAVGDRIPSELGNNPVRVENRCQLTVAGIALCGGSDEEVHDFIAILQLATQKYLAEDHEQETSASVGSDELRNELHLTEVAIRRVFRMIEWEPFTAGGAGSVDTQWHRNVGNVMRHFVRVATFDEYMQAKGTLAPFNRSPVVAPQVPAFLGPFAAPNEPSNVSPHGAPEIAAVSPFMAPDPHRVFVVHGRNSKARDSMFAFLRALGLQPIEWSQAIAMTAQGSPYIGTVLDTAFSAAQAIVVLFTPDEMAYLRPEYSDSADDPESTPLAQARPNVLFEAGMAIGRDAKRTVLVELGRVRPFSDLMGRHAVRLDGTSKARIELAQRLETAGCAVDRSGTDWLTAGDFTRPPEVRTPSSQRLAKPRDGQPPSPGPAETVEGVLADLPAPNPRLKGIARPTFAEGYLTGILIEAFDEQGTPVKAAYRYVFATNGNGSQPQESCCTPLSIGMGGIPRGTSWSISGWVKFNHELAPLSGNGVAP